MESGYQIGRQGNFTLHNLLSHLVLYLGWFVWALEADIFVPRDPIGVLLGGEHTIGLTERFPCNCSEPEFQKRWNLDVGMSGGQLRRLGILGRT